MSIFENPSLFKTSTGDFKLALNSGQLNIKPILGDRHYFDFANSFGHCRGVIYGDDLSELIIDDFEIKPENRRIGLGTRLLKELSEVTKITVWDVKDYHDKDNPEDAGDDIQGIERAQAFWKRQKELGLIDTALNIFGEIIC